MSPASYGELALGLTFVVFLNQLLFGPFSNSFTRFYSVFKEKNQLNIFSSLLKNEINNLLFITVIINFIVLFILFCCKKHLILFGLILVFFAFFTGINSIFDGVQNAARQRRIVVFHQVILNLLKISFALLFIITFSESAFFALTGYLIASIIILFSQKLFLRTILDFKKDDHVYDSKFKEKIRNYAYPFIYWGIFSFMHQVSDKWALQLFDKIENVGNYAVLFQLGYSPIILLTTVLVKVISPILFEKAGDATDYERMKKIKNYNTLLIVFCLSLSLIAFGITSLMHEMIFSLLVARAYSSSSFLLPIVVLAAGLFATGQVGTIYQLSKKNSEHLIMPKIITSIIGLGLNFLGAYLYGIKGVIYSLLAFSAIYLFWIVFITYKETICEKK